MSNWIGTEIAGFRIESEIGRGGMGVVYLAHQEFPERRVALKLLSPYLADDPAFRERFIRESNAAASTEHPHIVPVYEAGEADGHLYLAMRYVEGTDLGTLLERERSLSPERASRICAEIADALGAAHERGLIHRDVKPGNILLDGRDHAYLTDFGLIRRTKLHTDLTKTGQFMGTIDYVAPEQIKGGQIDGRADVYSLGCVLYECITGSRPFERDTEVATIYAHLEDPPPRPGSKRPGMSPALAATAQKAMAKRPEDRFSTAGEMADALRGGTTRRRGPRRILMAAIAGLVVVALAVAAIVTLSHGGEEPAASATSPSAAAVPSNSLLHLDAGTGKVMSATPIPAFRDQVPAVELGEGGVWLLAATSVVHVDPVDGAIVASIQTGVGTGVPAVSLDTGFRTVWVGAPPGVMRIDPGDDQVLRSVPLGEPGVVQQVSVAVGESSAWAVQGSGDLTRIAPFTARKTGTADVAQSAAYIDVGFGSVWIVDDLRGTLTSVNPKTLDVRSSTPMSGEVDGIAAGAGEVWILDSDAGVVIPVDPVSLFVGSPIRVGQYPTDIATGLDSVWVPNADDGTISRIDPITGHARTIRVGGPVVSLAVDESTATLWVAVAQPRQD